MTNSNQPTQTDPQIDFDLFIYEQYQQAPDFPIITGFIQQQWAEYETSEEWRDGLKKYIIANLSGFLAEVMCYTATEIKMGCMPVFTPKQQEQVISDCLNMKHPTEQEVELVRCYGTKPQYVKIKLKSD